MTGAQLVVRIPGVLVIGSSQTVTVVLENASEESIDVVAGTSMLTFGLADLLDGVGPGLSVSSATDAWTASLDQDAASLVLTAVTGDRVLPGQRREIGIEGMAVATPTRVVATVATPSGFGVDANPQTVPVVVQATPPGQTLPVRAVTSPGRIAIQPSDGPTPPITSTITLTMRHQGVPGHDKPLVPKDKQKGSKPAFQLTPIYAGDAGALTTPTDAQTYGLSARTGQVYTHPWTCEVYSASPPTWTLKPTSLEVLGPNDAVEIVIENLVTHLDPGITTIYLQYMDVPGYKDGFIPFDVTKVHPEPGYLSLEVLAPQGEPVPGERTLDLAWSSFLGPGDYLQLTYHENGVQHTLTSTDDQLPLQATGFQASPWLVMPTTVTLAAFNGTTEMNRESRPADVQPAPKASGLTVSPALGMEQPVTLTWATVGSQPCTVTIDEFQGDEVEVPANGGDPVSVELVLHSDPNGAVASIGSFGNIGLHASTPPPVITVRVTGGEPSVQTQQLALAPAVGTIDASGRWLGEMFDEVLLTWSVPDAVDLAVTWIVYSETGNTTLGPGPLAPPSSGRTILRAENTIPSVTLSATGGWGPGQVLRLVP